ncbi:hypothetical protein AK812_SmicGene23378 [Symbiodinium microadriaticum]|uniref:Uncharacterized protein n=1 Tax=Symbiodinium microadriaticum TaxID=2951 RepID=A0A1Q9DHF5_SYMMI|nr:hypothetical protein AK812_SmicGene23378 [Symbiodinium microadriaticum]CAE7657370.1 unnamed protein product [Symbiodinium microadriaticum]
MLAAATMAIAGISAEPACPVLGKLDGKQCFGLDHDPNSTSIELCRSTCCADKACEVWQYNPEYGCWRGSPLECKFSGRHFCFESRGEQLRMPYVPEGSQPHAYRGSSRNFAETAAVDPYAKLVVEEVNGAAGEVYQVRRAGPRQDQMMIAASCWSHTRHPDWCCPLPDSPPETLCWTVESIRDHCCNNGISADGVLLYKVFHDLTSFMGPPELEYFHSLFGGYPIDEDALKSTQLYFRVGKHRPGAICHSADYRSDGSEVLLPLVSLLLASRQPMSRTFLNIGAGTCESPDPLYQLLASDAGQGFVGIAVEANQARLKKCVKVMNATPGRVLPVSLTMDPISAAEQLRPHLEKIFGQSPKPWPLDVLVVDVDGVDCLIIEELMRVVRPKVIQLEILAHIPPPFRFSQQWHMDHSPIWDQDYDMETFMPTAGCSLSYALHKFRPFGYHLLQLAMHDAVFVHKSIGRVIERGLRLKFPQDEFQCYRNSTLWLQRPASFVREWFFSRHPSTVLADIWSNISEWNQEIGRGSSPFTLDF